MSLRKKIEGLERYAAGANHHGTYFYAAHDGEKLDRAEVLALIENSERTPQPVTPEETKDLNRLRSMRRMVPGGTLSLLIELERKDAVACAKANEIFAQMNRTICHHEGCNSTATHGPSKKSISCWGHAGDWPEIKKEMAGTKWRVPSDKWHDFPSDEQIRACSTWWRRKQNQDFTGTPCAVDLRFIGDDLVDDSDDGPPLTLRGPSKPDAASFRWYQADRWQARVVVPSEETP